MTSTDSDHIASDAAGGVDGRSVPHPAWVIGVDGSDGARDAVRWAVAHAEGRAAALLLVSAWQTPLNGSPGLATPMALPLDDTALTDAARATAESEAEHAEGLTGLPVHAAVAHGNAARALLESAEDADLVVVGSRGRGGFGRLLLGSTSTQCATHADVPVAVVPHGHAGAPTRSIVVGVDGSRNSLAALEWAMDFATAETKLTVIWVWDATPLAVGADEFFFPDASETAEARFHHLVDEVVERHHATDVVVDHAFVHGRPRAALAEAASGADLLVLGARGHGAVGAALLGSVSTWLLHHVKIPVVVVPHAHDVEPAAAEDTDTD